MVSANARPRAFGSGDTLAFIVATVKAAVRTDTAMPTPMARAQSLPFKECHFICSFRHVHDVVQQRHLVCEVADCIGGQETDPYEQNTQQSPGLGLRRAPQPVQS